MKILQLGKYFPPFMGGIETITHDLYSKINCNNIDISIDVLFSLNGHSLNESNTYKIGDNKLYGEDVLFSLLSTPISYNYIKRWKKIRNDYDIIHVHFPNPLSALCLYLYPTKARIIIHWHSDVFKQRIAKFFYKKLQDKILESANVIIVTSNNYLESSLDLRTFKSKCKVIPIGVEELNGKELGLKANIKNKLGVSNKKIIFSLGRLTYYKGFNYLIEAAKFLDDDYIILIAGVGELDKKLKKLVDDFNLSDKVKFLGRLNSNDLNEIFNITDVFCLPSIHRSEAFGLVQIEAMSLSIPIVSTNILGSGVSWVNKSGFSGIVVEPMSSYALANGIKDIFNNYDYYSKNAYIRYSENFTLDLMISEFEKTYKAL